MALPEEIQQQLDSLTDVLNRLEAGLEPLLKLQSEGDNAPGGDLDKAQVELVLARSINALLQLYLRASGIDPVEHEARRELDRLAQYEKKVNKAVSEKELKESKRKLEVNVAALNRMITAAVPELRQPSTSQQQQPSQDHADKDGEKKTKKQRTSKGDSLKEAAEAFMREQQQQK